MRVGRIEQHHEEAAAGVAELARRKVGEERRGELEENGTISSESFFFDVNEQHF